MKVNGVDESLYQYWEMVPGSGVQGPRGGEAMWPHSIIVMI